MNNIGFIGCGNMAQAIIGGILKAKISDASHIFVSNPSEGKLILVKNKFNVNVTFSNKEAAKAADYLFLAVKPYKYEDVIREIKDTVKKETVIISIAPGITIDRIKTWLEDEFKVVRSMPNTPALVGEGMSAVTFDNIISSDEKLEVIKIFKGFGKVEVIDEKLMDVVPGISGSSPAYVFMFIEALADGAVKYGIPRDQAYRMAAQAVLGSAKMVLETGLHPGKLKDDVCSPGGTTIEAVYSLEKSGFRASVIGAVESCTEKTINMAKK